MNEEQAAFFIKNIIKAGDRLAYWPVTFLKDAIKLELLTLGSALEIWRGEVGSYVYDGVLAKWARAAQVSLDTVCIAADRRGLEGREIDEWKENDDG